MQRQDYSFLYQKNSDGYLVTIRGDFAEMTRVNVVEKRSQYIKLEAPVDVIRQSVNQLIGRGYRQVKALELSWRALASDWQSQEGAWVSWVLRLFLWFSPWTTTHLQSVANEPPLTRHRRYRLRYHTRFWNNIGSPRPDQHSRLQKLQHNAKPNSYRSWCNWWRQILHLYKSS